MNEYLSHEFPFAIKQQLAIAFHDHNDILSNKQLYSQVASVQTVGVEIANTF